MNSRSLSAIGPARLIPGLLFAMSLLLIHPPGVRAEELRTKNGKVFTHITAVTDGGDKVRITHDAGIAAVAKKDVPAEFLTQHGISLDATPLKPATPPAPAPPAAASGSSGKEKEERALTALSILGPREIPVELFISNYENDTFVGEATFIEMKAENETVTRGYNGLQRRAITETVTVGVPVKWHLIAPLRVHGLPKSLALGPKLWQGRLWIGWMRNREREAFTSKEAAVKYMVEHGPGVKPARTREEPEFFEQTPKYLRERGLWTGPDTTVPAPSF